MSAGGRTAHRTAGTRPARRAGVRLVSALCLGMLVHGAGSCVHPAAADPGDCEPLTAASLTAIGDQLGLDDAQRAWLAARLAAGRLAGPEDLDALPGAGPEEIEALAASLCWGREGRWESQMSERAGAAGTRREAEARVVSGGVEASGRARWQPGEASRFRGGLAWRRGSWRIRGGTLRARRSLGLLVATPGAEPRGTAPVTAARGGWGTTHSLDPDIPAGGVLGRFLGADYLELALVRGPVTGGDGGRSREWWGTLSFDHATAAGRWGAAVIRSGGRWSAGASLTAAAGPGTWSVEMSRSAAGHALGTALALAAGSVRMRAGLTHTGAGYRIPGMRLYRDADPAASVRFGAEARWSRDRGRRLRVLVSGERTPGAGAWPRVTRVQELEVTERLRARVHLAVLWRLTIHREAEMDARDELLRSDLVYRSRGWRVRLRIDRRTGDAAGELLSLHAGKAGPIPWEAGMDRVAGTGDAPWVYRRRAGSLYGWDRLGAGTWIGGWIRMPLSRWEMELSAHGRSTGYDAALALRLGLGLP